MASRSGTSDGEEASTPAPDSTMAALAAGYLARMSTSPIHQSSPQPKPDPDLISDKNLFLPPQHPSSTSPSAPTPLIKSEGPDTVMPPATRNKKKGTATVVKASKKSKRAHKKSKAPAKKKTKADPSGDISMKDNDDVGDEEGDDADDDDQGSDHGPYCICRGPDDHRWMIQCDGCEDWFHGECVKIRKEIGETLIQSYICPNCTDGKQYVTRYSKTCSFAGCMKPARVYNTDEPSVFCSDEHKDQWWEQMISKLPKESGKDDGFRLTQENMMGLLSSKGPSGKPWKLGDKPFEVPKNFWDTVDPHTVLTYEESELISASAAARYALAEETMLCKKMAELLDMANARHRGLIAAGEVEKDACGYDTRLDEVGVSYPFAEFLKSEVGAAIFAAGSLDTTPDGMCRRRKCKPHNGWYGIFTRDVKVRMKEFAREAEERLEEETRIKNGAAGRHFRKQHEKNWVEIIESNSEGEDEDEEEASRNGRSRSDSRDRSASDDEIRTRSRTRDRRTSSGSYSGRGSSSQARSRSRSRSRSLARSHSSRME